MKSLLGKCHCPQAEESLEVAERIADKLGYKKDDIIVCKHPSKSEIGDHLKKLKQIAQESENDINIKAQAFIIINIGNMINPSFASHRDLLTDLGLESAQKQTIG